MLKRFDDEGNRWQLWPIRLAWVRPLGRWSSWFVTHGWQTGTEPTGDGSTAFGLMPGLRKVFGQTLHLGRLKVKFGKDLQDSRAVHNELIRTNYEHLLRMLGVNETGPWKLTDEWSAAVREILRLQEYARDIERAMASIGRPWAGRSS